MQSSHYPKTLGEMESGYWGCKRERCHLVIISNIISSIDIIIIIIIPSPGAALSICSFIYLCPILPSQSIAAIQGSSKATLFFQAF